MIKTQDFDIVGSYNNQRVVSIDPERSVNAFEYLDALGKKKKTLINTSGLMNTNLAFPGATRGFRGQFVFQNNEYVVIGGSVYRISPSNVVVFLGNLTNTESGYVGIDANTFQVIFVDGVNGYIWDTMASTFTMITDTSFPAQPIDVCFLDGFFVVANGNTNNFELSSFNQGMVWGPAQDTFTASAVTDLLTVASTANYATGIPVELSATGTQDDVFTASAGTDLLTIASTASYSTGVKVRVSNSGGALPGPLVAATDYFVISNDATTLYLATTLDNALAGTHIDLIDAGSGTNTLHLTGQLPVPLTVGTDYYCIKVSPTTFYLADSYANAISGVHIDLKTNGALTMTVTSNGQLQLGSITTHPGNIVACRTLHRRLFLFSQNYTEVWENAGAGTNLPFRRNNSLLMEYGTPAIGSVSVGFDNMFFLSQDRDGLGSVMQVTGTQSVPVSTRAIDFQFAQYAAAGQIADCRAFLIKENGLIFYRMNFTLANHTWVYDVTLSNPQADESKLWHEEEVLNGDRHPAQTHAYFNGKNYVGHYDSPILYQLSSDAYTNDGEVIRRMRITRPFVPPGYQRIRIDRLQVDMLQGNIANIDSQYEELTLFTENSLELLTEDEDPILLEQEQLVNNPQDLWMFLSISKDGGQTYGYSIRTPMGKVGERSFRTLWRKLGTIPRGQAFVAKFEFFDAVPFVVLGASWAMEVLPE